MYKKDANGQEWVLRTPNGTAHVGSHYADFRGDMAELVGGTPPHHDGSTGKVQVKEHGDVREYYPGVYDMVWMKVIPTHRTGNEL